MCVGMLWGTHSPHPKHQTTVLVFFVTVWLVRACPRNAFPLGSVSVFPGILAGRKRPSCHGLHALYRYHGTVNRPVQLCECREHIHGTFVVYALSVHTILSPGEDKLLFRIHAGGKRWHKYQLCYTECFATVFNRTFWCNSDVDLLIFWKKIVITSSSYPFGHLWEILSK